MFGLGGFARGYGGNFVYSAAALFNGLADNPDGLMEFLDVTLVKRRMFVEFWPV